MIWVAVGGRGTLYGAVAGAVLVNYAKTYLTARFPKYGCYALGALFVLVTLFLPRGIVGLLSGACRKQLKMTSAHPGGFTGATGKMSVSKTLISKT